ncbi:c-type cytochrome [Halomonas sediminis]
MMKTLSVALVAATAALAFSVTAQAEPDGEAIYNQACMACHMTGAAGAPIKGDADAWEPRLEKGMEILYTHSIEGFNAMPPKGGNLSLSDEEVKASVDFMISAVE